MAYAIGSGVVAPNGVGEHFFRAVAEGKSGIRSLNGMALADAKLFSDFQPHFAGWVIDRLLPQDHEIPRALNDLAQHLGAGPLVGFDADVLGMGLPRYRDLILEPFWPPAPTPIQPLEITENGRKRLLWFDAFGAVPNELLFPYLLPLLAVAVRRLVQQGKSAADTYIQDLVMLSLPRAAQLALVSSALAILDAAGATPATSALFESHQLDLHAPGSVASYLDAIVESLGTLIEEALQALGAPRRHIGLVVGTAGGSIEAQARCQKRFGDLGLNSSSKPIRMRRTSDGRILTELRIEGRSLSDWHLTLLNKVFFNDVQQISSNYLAGVLGRIFGLSGEQSTVSTGCCSGAVAAITAARTIATGEADAVLVTGTDCSSWTEIVNAFLGNGKLAIVENGGQHRLASRPYDAKAPGWVLGDGAASVVLSNHGLACERRSDPSVPLVAFTHASVRNTASLDPNPPWMSELVCRAVGAAPERPGLVLGYAPGDRVHGGSSIDQREFENTARVARQNPGKPLRLGSLKGLVGHSMGGSSAMAIATSHRLLAGRWPRSQGRASMNLGHKLPQEWCEPADECADPLILTEDFELDDIGWTVCNGLGLGGTTCSLLMVSERDPSPRNR